MVQHVVVDARFEIRIAPKLTAREAALADQGGLHLPPL